MAERHREFFFLNAWVIQNGDTSLIDIIGILRVYGFAMCTVVNRIQVYIAFMLGLGMNWK